MASRDTCGELVEFGKFRGHYCGTISQEILRNCLRYLSAKRLASDRSLTLKLLKPPKRGQQYRHNVARRNVNSRRLLSQVVVLCLGLSAVARTPGVQEALTSA